MSGSGCYLTVDLPDGGTADDSRGIMRLLDILAEAPGDRRATFFAPARVAAARSGLLADLGGSGHEIGCYGGAPRSLDRASLAQSLAEAREALEAAAGQRIVGLRAPELAAICAPWPLEALAKAGFAYDSSLLGVRRRAARTPYDAYAFPAGTVYEFPLHQAALPGGIRIGGVGRGHLRRLPLPLLLKLMHRTAAEGYVPVVSVDPADLEGVGARRTGERLAGMLAAFPNHGPLAESVPGLASTASLRRAVMRLVA